MKEILERIERFDSEFRHELEAVYINCKGIVNICSWYTRLDKLTKGLERGNGSYRQVEDHIFELKVADYVRTSCPDSVITYQPKGLRPKGKNCDLELRYGGRRYLVEVKCFHPELKKREIATQHAANNKVIMDAQSYHTYHATRRHVLDSMRAVEEKLENYDPPFTSVLAVPDGFYLNVEDFRDIVFIYRNGKPRLDDPLGRMTTHNLGRPFAGTIDQFWAFPFLQQSFSLAPPNRVTVVSPLAHNDREVQF